MQYWILDYNAELLSAFEGWATNLHRVQLTKPCTLAWKMSSDSGFRDNMCHSLWGDNQVLVTLHRTRYVCRLLSVHFTWVKGRYKASWLSSQFCYALAYDCPLTATFYQISCGSRSSPSDWPLKHLVNSENAGWRIFTAYCSTTSTTGLKCEDRVPTALYGH